MKEFWNLVVLAVCGTYGVYDLSLLTKPYGEEVIGNEGNCSYRGQTD